MKSKSYFGQINSAMFMFITVLLLMSSCSDHRGEGEKLFSTTFKNGDVVYLAGKSDWEVTIPLQLHYLKRDKTKYSSTSVGHFLPETLAAEDLPYLVVVSDEHLFLLNKDGTNCVSFVEMSSGLVYPSRTNIKTLKESWQRRHPRFSELILKY